VNQKTLLSIQEASQWASHHTGKNITPSNISYLIQYGRIQKIMHNGQTQVIAGNQMSTEAQRVIQDIMDNLTTAQSAPDKKIRN